MKAAFRALGLGVVLALGGCATVPKDPVARAEFKANHDPLEPMNRHVFAFNQVMDRCLIRPVAVVYVIVLPAKVRDAVRHCLDNFNEPLVLANCLLRARWKDARTTAGRFVVNSTIGVGGLRDVAGDWHWTKQTGDFGQTLARWKVKEGPYLVLPLLGPSSPRDGIGQGVDTYLDPWYYLPAHPQLPTWANVTRAAVDGIDQRARNLDSLEVLKRQSIDYYAALRSLYRQHRAAEIQGENAPPPLPPANFYDDPGR